MKCTRVRKKLILKLITFYDISTYEFIYLFFNEGLTFISDCVAASYLTIEDDAH